MKGLVGVRRGLGTRRVPSPVIHEDASSGWGGDWFLSFEEHVRDVFVELCFVFRASREDGALVVRVGVLMDVGGGKGYRPSTGVGCRVG